MNINNKQNLSTEELIQKTVALRKKIESLTKGRSSKEIYIEILSNIEKVLSSSPVDIQRLRQDKIGIGRVVTDGDENTPIGQEILLYHTAIHNYLKTIETLNKE
jgi:hypothetical protein